MIYVFCFGVDCDEIDSVLEKIGPGETYATIGEFIEAVGGNLEDNGDGRYGNEEASYFFVKGEAIKFKKKEVICIDE